MVALAGTAYADSATPARASRNDKILIMGMESGSQTVAAQGDATRAEYSFNDRGRGDHIIATWKLDAAGVPTEYSEAVTTTSRLPWRSRFISPVARRPGGTGRSMASRQ